MVACSDCKTYMATESRFAQVKCQRCGRRYWLAERKKFWEGNDARDATLAVQGLMTQRFTE